MPYGIEIEVEKIKPKHAALHLWNVKFAHRDWSLKGDGSLDNGTEAVSGIMPFSYQARDQAIDLMEELRKAGAKPQSKSCSVHIHCSPDEGVNKAAWVIWFARNIVKHDEAIAKRFTREERRGKWAQACTDHHRAYAALDPTKATMADIKAVNYRDRYWGANIGSALNKYGTIELRYFDGTKRKNDIYRYVEIARTLNHHAMMGTVCDEEELLLDDETYKASFARRPVTVKVKTPHVPDPYENHEGYPIPAILDNLSENKNCLLIKIVRLLEENPTWDFNMDEVDLLGRKLAYLVKTYVRFYDEMMRQRKLAEVHTGRITSSTPHTFDMQMHKLAAQHTRVIDRLKREIGCDMRTGKPLEVLRRFCVDRSNILNKFLPPMYVKPILNSSGLPIFQPDPDDMPCTCESCQRSIRQHYRVI